MPARIPEIASKIALAASGLFLVSQSLTGGEHMTAAWLLLGVSWLFMSAVLLVRRDKNGNHNVGVR